MCFTIVILVENKAMLKAFADEIIVRVNHHGIAMEAAH
jgi:hypothetical protein